MTKETGDSKKAKKRPQGSYDVGYAKPPERTRFKPGNKFGKKGGRPKGRKNTATQLREILEQKIEVTLPGGKTQKLTMFEAATLKVVAKALGGDARAYAVMMQLAEQVGIEVHEPPPPDEALATEEAAILDRFLATVAAEAVAEQAAATRIPPPQLSSKVQRVPGRPTVRRVTFGPPGAEAGAAGRGP